MSVVFLLAAVYFFGFDVFAKFIIFSTPLFVFLVVRGTKLDFKRFWLVCVIWLLILVYYFSIIGNGEIVGVGLP